MPDPAAHIGLVLAAGSAGQALERALAAAKKAGERVLSDYWHRSPAEQFALASQTADEVLEGLAVELIGCDQGGGQRPAE